MKNREINVMLRKSALALLVLGLAGCNKKEPTVTDPIAPEPVVVTEAGGVSCHLQLQKLMDALPSKAEVEGQKITGRDCKSGMASITYGSGEPIYIRFELTALKYPESDLEPLGARSGQDLLDGLRKTMEAKIVVNESLLKVAGDPGMSSMSAAQRAELPRQITLPNGVKAIANTDGGGSWELDSVMSDRHMLVIQWSDSRKDSNADEAVAALSKLAAEVHYEKLK